MWTSPLLSYGRRCAWRFLIKGLFAFSLSTPLLGLWVLHPAVGIQAGGCSQPPWTAPGPAGHVHPLPLSSRPVWLRAAARLLNISQILRGLKLIYVNGWWSCNAQWIFVNRKICCFEESWSFFSFFFSFLIFLFNFLWKNEVKTLKKNCFFKQLFLSGHFWNWWQNWSRKNGEGMSKPPFYYFLWEVFGKCETVIFMSTFLTERDSYILTSWTFVLNILLCVFWIFRYQEFEKTLMSTSL